MANRGIFPNVNLSWLLLVHQLPTKQETARVKIWRLLQKVGAVSVKNSVSALPDTEDNRRIFEQVGKEIRSSQGDAIIVTAEFLSGLNVDQLISDYNAIVREAYQKILTELKALKAQVALCRTSDDVMRIEHLKGRAISQIASLSARNFFKIDEALVANTLLKEVDLEIKIDRQNSKKVNKQKSGMRPSGATWVTRADPHVDRLASGWLIRRFIDPKAKVEFLDMDTYELKKGHFRFDVVPGEFTHEGDKCTFEVLVERFKIREDGLERLAQVIHDLDIQDEKYGLPETEGIRLMLNGVIRTEKNDHKRLILASQMFDGLLFQLSGRVSKSKKKSKRGS